MNDSHPTTQVPNRKRRSFLYMTTAAVGMLGAGFAAWPLIGSMTPAADNRREALEVDLTSIGEGQNLTVMLPWESTPVFIRHRTPSEIEAAANVSLSDLRDPETDSARAPVPRWIVVAGVCTYGWKCIPFGQKATDPRGEFDGWFCHCCASHFDTSGRIRKGTAANNLRVPIYEFLNETTLAIYSMRKPSELTG